MLIHIRHLCIAAATAIFMFGSAAAAHAACIPVDLPTPTPRDPVARVLAQQDACPRTAIEFRNILKRSGAHLEPTMVNFEGFHNPGAFFIFEIVSTGIGAPASALAIKRGDLLFGHFTRAIDGRLVSETSGLVIELITWDPDKQFYNFYELFEHTWFYRGDSKDILDDVRGLHRQRAASEDPFGPRLRCSGCHINGGLLQKELVAPHNDWFLQARHLPLDPLKPDASVKGILAELVDAEELSKLVAASPRRLADSAGYRKVLAAHGMQERLRPLFCPVEVNIESDSDPFDARRPALRIPSGFFVDPRLGTADISVKRQAYDAALQKLGSRLPRTPGRADADHAWLTPVKAHSDIVAVDALIEQGIIDREFVADVLAVDFTDPAFASARCGLLKLVPDSAGPNLIGRFRDALRGASAPGAAELLGNLTDPKRNAAFHEQQALAFVASCRARASDPAAVLDWMRMLAQRRVDVSASEFSKNPNGHILEDPERIVFPSTTPPAAAKRLVMTPACQVR